MFNVTSLSGILRYVFAVVEANGKGVVVSDRADGSKITSADALFFVRGGELNAVARRQLTGFLPVDGALGGL